MPTTDYVIVPIEPTDEMLANVLGGTPYADDNKQLMSEAYIAMLSASPTHNLTIIDKDELEGLRRDAERYSWLRPYLFTDDCGDVEVMTECSLPNDDCIHLQEQTFDAAIDEAIARRV